ncbi:MAG: manganese transporter [Piscirickettsiaceae bacterium CG_4_9_14_3_um_filter_43_564]|nr:zinc ABC transporter solute-binding protein [Thiomicrospira sp.]OIP96567.1 MAG: manganese transporter [Thiomicrospira sp. CG2_30_44_34]PIQ02874.1 MAG: manganese transporter [Piscirickettsiaceae bacterium CG18_big_fil_WC_8_21_14_2_50_44_103]PIU38904.1 MAG: manganese transporter [Piscirickettsiaceae bacterium CG07_land_8_20_14_0_80_44_28]PIW57426.1 MAG: manganese transporter [Piscirickettsiaceae bacterium CG12_big_fil_rev_8_21_14_0_65_44_934]PIW78353.1 MAG: manganese transporter [Piscirickett
MKRLSITAWFLSFVLVLFVPSSSWSAPLKVVATTGMIGDVVQQLGQDKIALSTLMGTGVDPHLYKATHGDMRRLQQAEVIFYNGLHLEGKMQSIFHKMARSKAVYAVSEGIPKSDLIHYGSVVDPHIWFDVSLWQQAVETVLEKLIRHDPKHQAFYNANAKRYLQTLTALHQWVLDQINTLAPAQRVLITAHDAFGYFGRAYGMEVRGLQGISTVAEFGLHDLKQLKDLIVARQIPAVFVESSVPKKFLQALVAGVSESGHDLKIGGELYSDAMGLANTAEGTYVGMVQHNVLTIVKALKQGEPSQ